MNGFIHAKGSAKGYHVRVKRNAHGKGWVLYINVGPGAGYRWIDLPGHTNNIHDGWRCRWLTIPGYTLTVGTNQREYGARKVLRFVVKFSRRSVQFCPNWR